MHPGDPHGIPRSCLGHGRGSRRHGIHARVNQACRRLDLSDGIRQGCHRFSDDDREGLHVTGARLQHRHRGRDEGGGDQNGSSWNRWL